MHDRQPDSTQICQAGTVPGQLGQPEEMPGHQEAANNEIKANNDVNPGLDPLIQQHWNLMMANISSGHTHRGC